MLATEFPIISSNLKAGYGVYGTADPYNSALPNNGALNPLGATYYIPPASCDSISLATTAGYGAGLWVKYVLYYDSGNTAMVAGPAPVYYKDNTFTSVTGLFSGGLIASKSVSCAGWLLPNTGSVAGIGVGSAVTSTILNNGTSGSYVFIAISGFVGSAYLAAGSAGDMLYGSGNFATTGVTPDGATTYSDFKFIGVALAAAGNIGNVLAWGWPF
jgi:hypothetical protein